MSHDADVISGLLAKMVFVRRFEEAVQRLFLRGEVYGSTHLCIGQEGVSAGICAALEDADWMALTYRAHGHLLCRDSDPQAYMDELLGRATGTGGGRAGSMNAVDLSRNIIGCFGIVGGALAAATGVAMSLKRSGGAIAVGFMGDGATNQGYFHECLNFAQALSLPVVFVCENNGYGEYTPTEVTTMGGVVARPRALGMQTYEVDGQEAWTVMEVMRAARAFVLERGAPAFVEARTYRFSDHGRGDPIKYRPDGEVERWRERDPIALAIRALTGGLGVAAPEVERIVAEQARRVEEIVERALAAPWPDAAGPAWPEFATAVAR